MKYALITIIFLNFIAYNFSQSPDASDLFASREVPDEVERMITEAEMNATFLDSDVSLKTIIESTDPERGDSYYVSRFFRRDRDGYALSLQEEPVSQLGWGYLQTAEGTWQYDPESRQFLYSSPHERFGYSDATLEDLKSSTILKYYTVLNATEVQLGSIPAIVFSLQAKSDEERIAFLRLWLSQEPALILKQEDYSLTKRLLQTTYIPHYIRIQGGYFPTQTIIVNNTVEGRRTTITQEDISLSPLPDTIFTKAYVERVNR